MKTWRERIAEARERRDRWYNWPRRMFVSRMQRLDTRWPFAWPFTAEDHDLMVDWYTCLAGRTARDYGLSRFACAEYGPTAFWAVCGGKVEEAERLLDLIEDRALQLKREQA